MNKSFTQLDKEKQNRIIESASKEFIEKGFKKASTNQIAHKAQIGKGMLFHYFNSKKELFNDLFVIHTTYIKQHFLDRINDEKRDFISKYEHISQLKLEAMIENPIAFNFGASLYMNDYEGLDEEQKKYVQGLLAISSQKLYADIDTSFFRQNMDETMMIKMISWIIEGALTEVLYEIKHLNLIEVDYSPYWKKFELVMDNIRQLYYREG